MSTMFGMARHFADGRRRLQEWLPAARAEAAAGDAGLTDLSPLARAQEPYVTEANLDAVLIHPGRLGGWHADVVLKSVPLGVGNSIGTAVEKPSATREEAEHLGRTLLVMCLVHERRARAMPPVAPAPAPFVLYGCAVPLSGEGMLTAAILNGDRRPAPEMLGPAIAGLVRLSCPGGFTLAAYEALPGSVRDQLLGWLHLAALGGMHAYPLDQDGAAGTDPAAAG